MLSSYYTDPAFREACDRFERVRLVVGYVIAALGVIALFV